MVCFPYLQRIGPGHTFGLDVQVTNHAPEARLASATLELPEGWSVETVPEPVEVQPGDMAALTFQVRSAGEAATGRSIIVADLTLGERHYGQRAEAIVDIGEPANA